MKQVDEGLYEGFKQQKNKQLNGLNEWLDE
jgi:hypothetical protein